MKLSLGKLSVGKKEAVVIVGILVVIALMGAAIYTVFKNTASADTAGAYTMYGYFASSTISQSGLANLTVTNVSPQKSLSGSGCGASTAVTRLSGKTDGNGRFIINNIMPGCFTFKASNGETFSSVILPANWANKWASSITGSKGTLMSIYLVGAAVTPTPTTTRSVTPITYPISLTMTYKSTGDPVTNFDVRNVAPQYAMNPNGSCSTTTVAVTSASTRTDRNGKFNFNLPDGCYTFQYSSPNCPADQVCTSGGIFGKIGDAISKGAQILTNPAGSVINVIVNAVNPPPGPSPTPGASATPTPSPIPNPGPYSGTIQGKVTAGSRATPPTPVTPLEGIVVSISGTAIVDGATKTGTYASAITGADGSFTTGSLPTQVKGRNNALFPVTYSLTATGSPTLQCFDNASQNKANLAQGANYIADLALGGCITTPMQQLTFNGTVKLMMPGSTTPSIPPSDTPLKLNVVTGGTMQSIDAKTGSDGKYTIMSPVSFSGHVFSIYVPSLTMPAPPNGIKCSEQIKGVAPTSNAPYPVPDIILSCARN